MTDEAEQLASQVAAGGALHAANQLGNDLAGLLWGRQQAANDPDEKATWRDERAAVRQRQRVLVPDSSEVVEVLRQWGDRIRELRA